MRVTGEADARPEPDETRVDDVREQRARDAVGAA
jgi:hypothetical protein